MKGKHHTESAKKKMSEAHKRKVRSPEHCQHLSMAMSGENHPSWRGGVSFDPYCPKFNHEFKERVRNFFGRKCLWCNKPESKNKTTTGKVRRLTVHHITFDKMMCCNDSPKLVAALCMSCSKKADYDRTGEKMNSKLVEIIITDYKGKCFFTKEETKL